MGTLLSRFFNGFQNLQRNIYPLNQAFLSKEVMILTSHPFLLPFQSIDYVKKYLEQKYARRYSSDAKSLAYQNGYSFLYYIEMGRQYVEQAHKASLATQPVLLFYGCVQWMKACLLTVDPSYPSTTQVLAHGVTTRKRKKQDYSFLKDEVKVQKEGLFPYFSEQMFHVKQLTGEKYKLSNVIRRLPEMASLIQHIEGEYPLTPITLNTDAALIPSDILTSLDMEIPRFNVWLQSFGIDHAGIEENDAYIHLPNPEPLKKHPYMLIKSEVNQWYLPSERDNYLPLPELFCHYLTLYNLSMICRYETEWWCELLHSFSSNDYPYIEHFLTVTKKKLPALIEDLLK